MRLTKKQGQSNRREELRRVANRGHGVKSGLENMTRRGSLRIDPRTFEEALSYCRAVENELQDAYRSTPEGSRTAIARSIEDFSQAKIRIQGYLGSGSGISEEGAGRFRFARQAFYDAQENLGRVITELERAPDVMQMPKNLDDSFCGTLKDGRFVGYGSTLSVEATLDPESAEDARVAAERGEVVHGTFKEGNFRPADENSRPGYADRLVTPGEEFSFNYKGQAKTRSGSLAFVVEREGDVTIVPRR
jgi:hypothetical protein